MASVAIMLAIYSLMLCAVFSVLGDGISYATLVDEDDASIEKPENTRRHGLSEDVFRKLKEKVVRCKVLMLRNENKRVDKAAIEKMDEFLWGILPTIEQAEVCIEDESRRIRRKATNFNNEPVRKWNFPIYYKFDGSQTSHDIDMIENAMRHWEKNSCVLFKRLTPETKLTEQHLLFTGELGCWSHVAKVPKSYSFPQVLNLQSSRGEIGGCTDMLGIPVHELGHVLGLWHEHIRRDRDKFVTYHADNVSEIHQNNFHLVEPRLINDEGVEYDLASVMHYGPKEMTRGTSIGLTTVNPLYQQVIGQRVAASFFDMKLVNKVYCRNHCTSFARKCKNSGYRNPTRCGYCICPEGIGGKFCDTVAPAKGGCWPSSSEVIKVASSQKRYVETRDFHIGKSYKNGDHCNWLFEAPAGCQISVHFEGDFGLYCKESARTCMQWVEIKYKKDIASRGPRFCCGTRPVFPGNGKLTSESNRMLVVFDGRYPLISNVYSTQFSAIHRRGFRLVYQIADSSCLPTSKSLAADLSNFFGNPVLPNIPVQRVRPCQPYPYCKCSKWKSWTSWSDCSRECGGCGKKMRYRKCIHPSMIQTERKTCNIVSCGTYMNQYRRLVDRFYKYQTLSDCCYNFKRKPPVPIDDLKRCYLVT